MSFNVPQISFHCEYIHDMSVLPLSSCMYICSVGKYVRMYICAYIQFVCSRPVSALLWSLVSLPPAAVCVTHGVCMR